MAFTVPTVYTAVDKYTRPVQKMANANRKFAKSADVALSKAERRFRKLTPNISGAAKQMLSFASAAAVTAGIVATLSFSVQSLKNYETALASTQAITGATNKEFVLFKNQIGEIAKVTKKSTIDVAKGFEIVGSAQPELLKNAAALGLVTKNSIILSKASGEDLASSSKSLTGVMNQFNIKAEDSARVMNALAAGSVAGSANIPNVAASMKNFGAVASASNISVEQAVSLIEVMGKKSIFAEEAGTKLTAAVINLKNAGVGYKSGLFNIGDALAEVKEQVDAARTAKEKDEVAIRIFKKTGITTGQTLLNNIKLYKDTTAAVTGTTTATKQAEINSNTLSNRLTEMSNRWVTLITTSGGANDSLSSVKKAVVFVTNNMETLLKVVGFTVGSFVAMKAILLVSRGALLAYNITLGVSAIIQGKSLIALRASVIAMKAAAFATKIVTAAQWLFNIALNANPIGLTIIGIVALIAVIAIVVKKYDEWGAAVSLLLGPLGTVINLVQSFRRNWDSIVQAFESEGIISGLKRIGLVILDAILMPFQQVLELASRIPGKIGDFAGRAASNIEGFRNKLELTGEPGEDGAKAVNPEAAKQESLKETITTQQQNVAIDINDKTGAASVESDNDFIPVNLTSTSGV